MSGAPEFDVVVVGGGTAGCAVVGWLCQHTNLRVCLVEAGPDYGSADSGRWPPELLNPRRQPMTHDWGFLDFRPDGSTQPEWRARVIGGCSAHNQCGAVWGQPSDYDAWAELGNPGWGFADLAPLIDRVERVAPERAGPRRGRHGRLPTRPYSETELSAWQRLFLEAALRAGFARLMDVSDPDADEGVAPFHANVWKGTRWNAAFAFLDPIRTKPNFTVLADTLADRLVICDGRAVGLVGHTNRDTCEIRASRFVLTAGAYGSPALLMRSGIGPKEHLATMGIRILRDLPGVGQNLHDHSGVRVLYEPSSAARGACAEDLQAGRFFESQVILRAKSPSCARGFDLHILPVQDFTPEGSLKVGVLVYNMVPQARGEVRLQGRNAHLTPSIELRLAGDQEPQDARLLLHGLRLARRIARCDPLAGSVQWETEPGEHLRDDGRLLDYIRRSVLSYKHPVGTCKMGPRADPMAVVNAHGRVHDMENLYVADASVIPQIPRANTNLTCMLIGLKIAQALAGTEC